MSSRVATCSCGQLQVQVEGEPEVGICHCLACQRRTGSAFATLAAFSAPFHVEGVASEYVRESGRGGERYRFRFCPTCGTNLFHTIQGDESFVLVAVGGFADPGFPAPRDSVWTSRKHAWVALPPDLSAHERDPD